MSFKTEIYPYRTNRAQFTKRLLSKVDSEFKKVAPLEVAFGMPGPYYTHHKSRVPGVDRPVAFKYPHKRCRFKTTFWMNKKIVCDFTVTLIDKKTVKALLKAWARQIDDRYLDRRRIDQMKRRKFRSMKEAFEAIRKNAPAGAVMFLGKEIEAWNKPALFGPKLNPHLEYNDYFSQLLKFDIERCGGLVEELARLHNMVGQTGGGSSSYVIDATMYWIHYQQKYGTGVYKEWRL